MAECIAVVVRQGGMRKSVIAHSRPPAAPVPRRRGSRYRCTGTVERHIGGAAPVPGTVGRAGVFVGLDGRAGVFVGRGFGWL